MKRLKGKNCLIICPGASTKEYETEIRNYIHRMDPVIIGVNRVTEMFVPDIHLWTNRRGFSKDGWCVNKKSLLLLNAKMPKEVIKKHWKGKYKTIEYIDKEGEKIRVKNGKIMGWFRSAGVLALMVAHVYGAKHIRAVGMDGYLLHPIEAYEKGLANQHCYGSGHSDPFDWKKTALRERQIESCLNEVKKFGVDFKIMTPTVFKEHFDKSELII